MTQNANNPSNTPPVPGQMPPAGDPPGQMPNTPPPGQMPPSGNQQHRSSLPALESLPPEVQEHIKALRKEAEDYRKARDAEAKAKADAEAARLKKKGEFEELAKQHEKRIQELEPIAESYTRLASTMNTQIEAEIKDWPPEVKSLVPGSDVPVESRLEHMNRLRPLLEKLQVQARGTQPGNSPNPRPSGQTPDNVRDEYEKRLRASGRYSA